MKILVVSLLRLGDAIMLAPIVNGLARGRADARVDMLTFKPVDMLHAMMPNVRRWWTMDRQELQAGLGRADLPALTSFAVLDEQLRAIDAEKYDLIINLTQTHFSAYVMGLLKSPDRLGLTFDLKGQTHFHSPWFRHLNESLDGGPIFHFTDVFMHACGLGSARADWSMPATEKGRAEAEGLALSGNPRVVFQMLTSDENKNWPMERWLETARSLSFTHPDMDIVALGAPGEAGRIQEFRARAEAVRVKILPAILSLEGARALLDRADLLITGDTSIKHLANAPAIRVLELCLGPSDPRRTGIYKENSLILQGQISADAVTGAARAMLGDNWFDIEALSRQHREARWMRTRQLATGYWFAADVTAMRPEIVVDDLVARCAWKLALNRGRDAEFIEFGSESVSLRRELGELFNDEHRAPLMRQLDFLESRESKKVEVANSALTSLRREFRADLPGDIAGYRRRQIALEKTREHSEFKTKLIRTLKSNWTESL